MELSKREEEIFFFSALFFYFKYAVHTILWQTLRDPRSHEGSPEQDTEWAMGVLRSLPKKDEQVTFFLKKLFTDERISEHPWVLQEEEIARLLRSLQAMFKNQEFCAQCEAWSYYDIEDPKGFAVGVTSEMLTLREFEGGIFGRGDPSTRIQWFEKIFDGDSRFNIVLGAFGNIMKEFGGQELLPLPPG